MHVYVHVLGVICIYIYIVITAYMLITTVGCIKLLNSDFFSDFWSSVLF